MGKLCALGAAFKKKIEVNLEFFFFVECNTDML